MLGVSKGRHLNALVRQKELLNSSEETKTGSCNSYVQKQRLATSCWEDVEGEAERLLDSARANEGVVRSMPMCIYAVGVYTYGILWRDHIGYAYLIYVWTWHIGWNIGIRYIFGFIIPDLYDG
jgi:hypothetical protein